MRTAMLVLATVSLLAGEGVFAVGAAAAEPATRVQPTAKEIQVGDLLQAVRDVSLDSAVIAEGSKISVSAKKSSGGRVILDVALADGHVVRGVPLADIRKSFRRVSS